MEVLAGNSGRGTSVPLCVITAYFNWCRFRSKLENYCLFREEMRHNDVAVLTVECALPDQQFQLPPSCDVIQVRTNSIMWQKERLLNIALEALPLEYKYVAWIDCDLIFQDRSWSMQATRTLESFGVVQLFDKMVRLPRFRKMMLPNDAQSLGFMAALRRSIEQNMSPRLGHPGFAWAARREVLEACNGFYDGCIIGGADRVMTHAWLGDYHAPIVSEIILGQMKPHYLEWALRAHRVVRGSVSSVDGTVMHLWHGESLNRLYFERHRPVAELGFNPATDLVMNNHGCWEWATEKPKLQSWIANYFASRKEDG